MKLNLGCGNDYRPGYVHIDLTHPAAIPSGEFRQGDMTNLDWVCGDGEVEEILAIRSLQCIPYPFIGQVVQGWINKLTAGGMLKIEVPDLSVIAQGFLSGGLTLAEAVREIYGDTQHPTDQFHRSGFDRREICALLNGLGLAIERVSHNACSIYVEARKP